MTRYYLSGNEYEYYQIFWERHLKRKKYKKLEGEFPLTSLEGEVEIQAHRMNFIPKYILYIKKNICLQSTVIYLSYQLFPFLGLTLE